MSSNELLKSATARPWVQNGSNGIHTVKGGCIAITHDDGHAEFNKKANAELIVKAVNSYDELLEVCEQALDYVNLMLQSSDEDSGEGELSYRLQKAIERAKGETNGKIFWS